MVDGTDNQKKVENAEKETALCFTRYTQANILRISSSTFCLEIVFATKSAVIKKFFMTDNDNNDGQNRLLNPACAYARGVITVAVVPRHIPQEQRGLVLASNPGLLRSFFRSRGKIAEVGSRLG